MWTGGFPADLGGIAKYAAQQGYKKVTAFVINAPSAIAGAQAVGAPLFKAAGVGFTIEPVPFGVADATPQVTAGLAGKPGAAAIVGGRGHLHLDTQGADHGLPGPARRWATPPA